MSEVLDSSISITELLSAWQGGSGESFARLIPLVERELRRIARRHLRRERDCHSLQTTALLNEAFIKLMAQQRVDWQNRSHFYAISARIMRRILINHARDRVAEKRGGGIAPVPLDGLEILTVEKSIELVNLDDALKRLAKADKMKSRIVELRFFAGLTVEEVASILGVTPNTVWVHWRFAKAWLAREIARD